MATTADHSPATLQHQSLTGPERAAITRWAYANRRDRPALPEAEHEALRVQAELAQLAGTMRRFLWAPHRTLGPADRDAVVAVVDRVLAGDAS